VFSSLPLFFLSIFYFCSRNFLLLSKSSRIFFQRSFSPGFFRFFFSFFWAFRTFGNFDSGDFTVSFLAREDPTTLSLSLSGVDLLETTHSWHSGSSSGGRGVKARRILFFLINLSLSLSLSVSLLHKKKSSLLLLPTFWWEKRNSKSYSNKRTRRRREKQRTNELRPSSFPEKRSPRRFLSFVQYHRSTYHMVYPFRWEITVATGGQPAFSLSLFSSLLAFFLTHSLSFSLSLFLPHALSHSLSLSLSYFCFFVLFAVIGSFSFAT